MNFYLIGYEDDTKKYFKALTENFKFLKKIDTDFKNIKKDLQIKKPALAITLSLDYLGRLEDFWERVTNFIYEETGKIIHFLLKKTYKINKLFILY